MKLPAKRIIDRNDRFGQFMLHCFASISKIREVEEAVEGEVTGRYGEQVYDVQLTINGVEIPVEEIIVSWLERCDESISHRAAEMVKSNVDSLQEDIEDANRKIKDILEDIMEKAAKKMGRFYDPYEDSIS